MIVLETGKTGQATLTDLEPALVSLGQPLFRQENQRRILIHVHGGLVSGEDAMRTGERLQGYLQDTDTELVLWVWHTGLWETIKDELSRVSISKIFGLLFDAAERGVARWLSPTGHAKSGIASATSGAVVVK